MLKWLLNFLLLFIFPLNRIVFPELSCCRIRSGVLLKLFGCHWWNCFYFLIEIFHFYCIFLGFWNVNVIVMSFLPVPVILMNFPPNVILNVNLYSCIKSHLCFPHMQVRGALETLVSALTPIDHAKCPKNEIQPALMNADLLSGEADNISLLLSLLVRVL